MYMSPIRWIIFIMIATAGMVLAGLAVNSYIEYQKTLKELGRVMSGSSNNFIAIYSIT
jgi:DNA-binding transcriptional regulator of glucitol operon